MQENQLHALYVAFIIIQAMGVIVMAMGAFIVKGFKNSADNTQKSLEGAIEKLSEISSSVRVLLLKYEHNEEGIARNYDFNKRNAKEIDTVKDRHHQLGNDMVSFQKEIFLKLDHLEEKVNKVIQ